MLPSTPPQLKSKFRMFGSRHQRRFLPPGIVEGILRYQLDHCPQAVTTATRLGFAQLSPGSHTITVVALGIDDRLLTPYATMHVKIP